MDTGIAIERRITGMIELLEHNKETYRKLCDVLSENNKCALVQATGTGKSYIAGKYIEEHAGKALILVPTNAISDAWDELLEDIEEKFDIVTYQAFAKKSGNYLDYDLVIADEMHHLGSDVWGAKFVDTYLQNENHKIIGLTATEIRYLDNSRDMAEEIFENIRVDGCDLPTAINTGVLPTFKYVSALYCDESDFDEWKEKAGKIKDVKVQEELKGKLDVCIKNMISVKQAVNENLTDDYKKIIVFLNNVESKETALEIFRDVFPTANFYDVDYSKQRKANNEQISRFKADGNRAVLFAVDMLNEGVHIKGTDCVIMFRKTVSPQIYLQQLGRGLASGAGKIPVIFDFVSNTENVRGKLGTQSGYGIIRTWNDSIEKDKKIMFKSYCLEIEELLLKISDLTGARAWTVEEEKYIYENYKKRNINEISKELNRRNVSVRVKMIRMGLHNPTRIRRLWTPEENKFLIENYKTKTISEIAKDLGRDTDTVRNRMKNIGIYKSPYNGCWNKEEKKFLQENKDKMTIEEISERIGRSQLATYSMLLRLSKERKKRKWSCEEDKFLIENCNSMEYKEIAKILQRTVSSVGSRALHLGLKKIHSYTEEERNFIKYNYGKKTIKEIAENLNRTENSVKLMAGRMGLRHKGRAVVQLSLSGEYIATYESIKKAGEILQKSNTSICECANKRKEKSHGYKWMYEEDYKKMLEEKKAGD